MDTKKEQSREMEVVVGEYLHGKTSIDEAINQVSGNKPMTFVDYVLKLVLPGDLYRRRLIEHL